MLTARRLSLLLFSLAFGGARKDYFVELFGENAVRNECNDEVYL